MCLAQHFEIGKTFHLA